MYIKKIIIPIMFVAIATVITLASFIHGASNREGSVEGLDGKYMLSKIVMPDGEVRNFSLDSEGELNIKDLKATFTTPTNTSEWDIEKNSYEVNNWGFIETNLDTNQKYTWMKINN
ncbi:MAG: hypothetical protein RR636_12590 [Clostridium sp.]|uniref:hypothetical protein n=1 Tax=Clostridium sp. TaxID=1506 RepID=UPI00305814A7